MRRSICSCEPSVVFAGDTSTWKFVYTTATPLPKGTRIKFDLQSKARDTDWEIPQCSSKEKANLIWAELPNKKTLEAKPAAGQDRTSSAFEFTLPTDIKVGESVTILIGTPESSREERAKKGNRCQTNTQRKRAFFIYIDPKGKEDYRDPEIFQIDVRGNVLSQIRAMAPSLVAKNRRFDVMVRFEDQFGNATGNAPEGTLIELSYEHLRDNLSWRLFVPETGFINLPNLYFNEPGVYKIQLRNLATEDKFFSAPIKCLAESDKSVFWGLLHGESEKYTSTEHIELLLRYFRDDRALQFYATSNFESTEETSNEDWKLINAQISQFNEDGRFNTLLGFQWFNDLPEEGLRQIVYLKDTKPILRKKDSKSNSLKKIYKSHNSKEFISLPSFTMGAGVQTTFCDFDPDFERVVEIYNSWGSSECTAKEGNLRPISCQGKRGIKENEEGSIRGALNRNCRLGFVAGGFDDRGVYANCFESDQVQYSPGLTAIIATEQTREHLLQALHHRSCYATTGERIILGFSIAGTPIGGELSTKTKPGLVYNRHIVGFVAGTAPIKEICIIRNGKPLHYFYPNQPSFDFTFDDSELLHQIALTSPDERPHFVYYYLRIVQEDGHIAWVSPIWIDYPDMNVAEATSFDKKKKKK